MEFTSDQSRKGNLGATTARSAAAAYGVPRDVPRLVTGNAGDHQPIHTLLRAANQAPSYEDFVTWLDEPAYEPTNRLLMKRGSQIIAHVHVLARSAWFQGVELPVGGLLDLAVLPEHREAGCESSLLRAADWAMRDHGAVLAFCRTDQPEVCRACGWSEVRGQRFTEANVSDILAMLSPPSAAPGRRQRPLRIRFWRHVELDALRSAYHHVSCRSWGAFERSEAYWRWLVSRKAHDELIVAVDGEDLWDDPASPANIVGYAVTRGSQVIELGCEPGYGRAARRLLARACQDAIERDLRTLSLHLPADDPLHDLMLAAGGAWSTSARAQGGTLLVKLLDPLHWTEALFPVLLRRAQHARIARPFHVTFDTDRQCYRFELTRRSGRLVRDDVRHDESVDVRATPGAMADLLVGNLDVAAACPSGKLEICDAATAERLAALFPPATFWQSQFDTLRF